MKLTRIALAALLPLFVGCSSGSDSNGPFLFPGTWEMFYNVVLDNCGLLDPELANFTDTQVVSENGAGFTITATALPSASYPAMMRSANSLLGTVTTAGDIFGIGLNCMTEENLSYDNLSGDNVDSLYTFTLLCDDGTACESSFRGQGERS